MDGKPSPESELSDPINMKESLANKMRKQSLLVSSESSSLKVYLLPAKEIMRQDGVGKMVASYSIGEPDPVCPAVEKVLMLVGIAGASKSTLINGIINYSLGVTWEDDFRFKLIADETSKSQADCLTSYITAYTLYHMEGSCVPYTLTFIDTSGFGDTRGIERDKIIVNQIKEFFSVPGNNGIDEIHGIGFVTQAALARLTPTQKYIFDSILAIFGKDIASNIFMMTTFSDGQDPPVLEAIRSANIPFKDSFKFNNSALFVRQGSGPSFDKIFWELGIAASFRTFFTAFEKAEPQNLQLTREVLKERHQLELVVKGIQPQINAGLNKIDELRQEEQILKEHEAKLLANKEFTYEVKVIEQGRVSTVTRTCGDLKKRYEEAKYWKSQAENVICILEDELGMMQSAVFDMIQQVEQCFTRLQEIALKPDPLTEVEYIDLLIEAEKREKKSGFIQRIKAFENVRQQAVIMHTIMKEGKEIIAARSDTHQMDKSFWQKFAYV